MIYMEIISAGREAARNRMRKYQQVLKGKGADGHEQQDCNKNVYRGCSTAN